MTEIKSAAWTGQRPDGSGKQISESEIRISGKDFTTQQGTAQGPVSQFLSRGEENAISAGLLVALVGCRSQRQLRRLIAAERARGALILSSTRSGYFLPGAGEQGRHEIQAYMRSMQRHARSTFRSVRAARRALKAIPGQEEMSL